MFKKYIYSQKANMVGSLCDLITYPSISEESNDTHFPFGKACSDALKYFLNLATSLGFRTKNVDGYCGWVEFGQGDELIGIIGHLDVVPANEDDWSYSPFTPTIAKNRIFGRGAIDDKGPVVASLYAMKAVMDYCNENEISIHKRIRLIVGLNEEKDWNCIAYYKEHEEIPSMGFSPDSDFPCIYAEKSVLSLRLSQNLSNTQTRKFPLFHPTPIQIESFDCENNAINVVPKIAKCVLQLEKKLSISSVISMIKSKIDFHHYDIDIYKIDDHHIQLTSYGTPAHSAHPDLGVNAISKLLVILNEVLEAYHCTFPLLSTFSTIIGDDYTGKGLHINFEDESGKLTLNTSQCDLQNNQFCIGINLRIPVTISSDAILRTIQEAFSHSNIAIDTLSNMPSLYIEKEHPLVQKLCGIFNETCGTSFSPIAIGGATYARAFPNFISFGMNFPGDKDMCHQVDEFVDIDKLILSSYIYAKAIYSFLDDDTNTIEQNEIQKRLH